jgi:hypothetical protein
VEIVVRWVKRYKFTLLEEQCLQLCDDGGIWRRVEGSGLYIHIGRQGRVRRPRQSGEVGPLTAKVKVRCVFQGLMSLYRGKIAFCSFHIRQSISLR